MRIMSSVREPSTAKNCNAAEVRILIAKHLDVDVERVTDTANFDDLGADWLDHLELMITLEDRFDGLKISDDDAERIKLVGDLIRYIECWQRLSVEPASSAGFA